MAAFDDNLLDPARRIMKYEYLGWAQEMVAEAYGLKDETSGRNPLNYAEKALTSLRTAVSLMDDAKRGYAKGDANLTKVYRWVTSPESNDLNRTNWLLALALVVSAEAGGTHTANEVREQIERVPEEYRQEFPYLDGQFARWAEAAELSSRRRN